MKSVGRRLCGYVRNLWEACGGTFVEEGVWSVRGSVPVSCGGACVKPEGDLQREGSVGGFCRVVLGSVKGAYGGGRMWEDLWRDLRRGACGVGVCRDALARSVRKPMCWTTVKCLWGGGGYGTVGETAVGAYREPVGRPVVGPVQMLVGNLKDVCGMAYGREVLRGMNGA